MFSGGRRSAYETRDESSDNLEKLTQRFSNDLRGQVRRLANHRVFSREWLGIIDEFDNLNKIAVMEHSSNSAQPEASAPLPSNGLTPKKKHGSSLVSSFSSKTTLSPTSSPSSTTNTSNSPSKSTLWDREEYCVRYVVEEAKLSQLFKYMSDFKDAQEDLKSGKVSISNVATELAIAQDVLIEKMVLFEEALGSLLLYCCTSVEAIQTCDIHHLISHCALCLSRANSTTFEFLPPNRSFTKTQEFLSLEYLRNVTKNLEVLQEQTVCGLLQDNNIVHLTIRFLEKFSQFLLERQQIECCELLSLIMDTEYFKTHKDKFLISDEDKRALLTLNNTFIKNLNTSYERKKLLRPLNDVITRLKITHS